MKKGDRVQVWDEEKYKLLGWGIVIEIAVSVKNLISGKTPEGIPLIRLESGKTIWGDRSNWITEREVAAIGVRLFQEIWENAR